MTTDLARIRDELALFADLGTAPPQYSSDGTRAMVRMIRKGEPLEILFEKHDKIIERSVDSHEVRPHASYRALLASTNFGDLGTWAYHQSQSLRELKSAYDVRIPVTGVLTDCDEARELDVGEFDQYLACRQLVDQASVRVMLIDGPGRHWEDQIHRVSCIVTCAAIHQNTGTRSSFTFRAEGACSRTFRT